MLPASLLYNKIFNFLTIILYDLMAKQISCTYLEEKTK